MKKRILALILAVVMAVSFVACGNSGDDKKGENTAAPSTSTDTVSSDSSTAVTLPLKDMAGNDIKIPEDIKTIASMAPSITQILVDLGLGDKIVAVDKNAKGMTGVKSDALIIDMMNPDAEQLAALKPDIILASGISKVEGKDPFKPLTDMGICIAYIPSSDSIAKIQHDILFVANATKTTQKGQELVDNMQKEIDAVAEIAKTITDKKTVYFEIAAAPGIYSFGSGVFLNEMIELIGAKNVLADKAGWLAVTDEAAVNANADVIFTNVTYIENPVAEIKARKGWAEMKAVKNGNVYYVDNFASSLPNHNIVKALKEMAKAVYPDKY